MKEKTINGILIFLVVIFIGALIFYAVDYYNGKTQVNETAFYLENGAVCSDKNVINEGKFRFCNISTEKISLYDLEYPGNEYRILYNFRNLPEQLEYIKVEQGIGYPLLKPETYNSQTGQGEVKEKLYLSVPSNFTYFETIFSVQSLSFLMGQSSTGIYKMDWQLAYSGDYNGSEYPIKSCKDANNNTAVIEFRRGETTQIKIEDNCIVAYGKDEEELTKVSEKLRYALLGVIKSG